VPFKYLLRHFIFEVGLVEILGVLQCSDVHGLQGTALNLVGERMPLQKQVDVGVFAQAQAGGDHEVWRKSLLRLGA
jgi:hypothetical protein